MYLFLAKLQVAHSCLSNSRANHSCTLLMVSISIDRFVRVLIDTEHINLVSVVLVFKMGERMFMSILYIIYAVLSCPV